MLQQLSIRNFALIDHIELDFKDGLTVITGETGAGKSILLGALALILGNRADHSSLKEKSKKCIVEGRFYIKEYCLQFFFDEYDLDYSDETILRREINPHGKSRSFINDTPVTLELLKLLGNRLIDIHSQQQSLQINDNQFQLQVLDTIAGNASLLTEYKEKYRLYRGVCSNIKQQIETIAKAKQEEDFLTFQFQELEQLNLQEGENESLEVEQSRFANSEELLRNLNQAQQILGEQDENIIHQVDALKQLLARIDTYDARLPELTERAKSISIELNDIYSEIEQHAESFEYNPERHQFVEERLAEIHRLQQKHLIANADDLHAIKDDLEKRLHSISFSDERLEKLRREEKKLELTLTKLADKLSDRRKAGIPALENKVKTTLNLLGIPYASMQIKYQKRHELSGNGTDDFEFLFSANKGVEPEKISKSASGGEVSRLMLAIKRVLAEHQQMPTILFDEIDTGVSGEIAEKMGSILAEIGKKRQVISITHLPQLAAKGKQHYFVYKAVEDERSITRVKALSLTERVHEVAKMLSGSKITDAAMNNAKELLVQ